MENYETLGVIGEGTYGVVMKARHRESGQLVAIKKFKESDEDEQVRKTSLREVRVLKQLRHENVITLLEVFRRKGKLYLVFEYVEKTILEVLEKRPNGLDEMDVRRFMYQLLRAVEYCHSHNIIHRDIKPENILIAKSGALKLCDFGFARTMSVGGKYTDYVATRWYRGPELLVGDVEYGKGVDVWAIGCIFAEISNGMPLFPGESDLDQLSHIMRCLGKLTSRHVQIFKRNPLFQGVDLPAPRESETLDQRFPIAPKPWLNFLKACLKVDSEMRETATGLLALPYFTDRGFKQEFDAELRIIFEKENRALNSFSTRRQTDPSPAYAPAQPTDAQPTSAPAGSILPPPSTTPAIPPRTPAGTNTGVGAPTGPSVGTLWSQYLATTATELPDLGNGRGTGGGGHPPIGHPTAGLFAPPVHATSKPLMSTAPPGPGLYYGQMPPSTPSGNGRFEDGLGRTSGPSLGLHSTSHGHGAPTSTGQSTGSGFGMMLSGTAMPSLDKKGTLGGAGAGGTMSSGLQFPTLGGAGGANVALGLSYKKKPAKRNVLSTLSITSIGGQPSNALGATGGGGGGLPYSYQAPAQEAQPGMPGIEGHHIGSQPRRSSKQW